MKNKILIVILLLIIGSSFWFLLKEKPIEQANAPEEKTIEVINNSVKEEGEERIISVSYPSLGIEEIDKEIKDFIDIQISQFKELEYVSFGGAPYSLDVSYFSTAYKDIISFKLNVSEYTGGAHGNHYVTCFTYNLEEKKKMSLGDFFNSDSYLEKISDYSINDLMKDEYAVEEWINEGAGPKIENFERFVITENAFIFYFPPYQVAPYAAGEKQTIILLNELKDYLNDNIFKDYDFSINKGIYVLSPVKGEIIEESPTIQGDLKYFLRVEGYLNGDNWAPFEAVGGRVELLDENNNVLASSTLEITEYWMKIPVYFRSYLFFNPNGAKKGTLVFYNDNASGLEENERSFSLPVNFK
ncbi:MAG: DUF3298 domain-containing protein [Candidatus Pacebacteria bacterium]|nr:DUF3298 domain-containing protein [Candidatus Paceibacterota bacterium]